MFAGHQWKGRKISVLRELFLISYGLLEKETSAWSESDWLWGMGAPCQSSKENKPECRETLNFTESQNKKILILAFC
jgi:hypothetical protein